MDMLFRQHTQVTRTLQRGLWTLMLGGMFVCPAQATEIFYLQLDPKPFSHSLCHKTHDEGPIRIKAARHRDLIIHRFPDQYVPDDAYTARRKDYTHFINLSDLSNGVLTEGSIAFRTDQSVIFTTAAAAGISRQAFMRTLPPVQQPIANQALNTYLRLQQILRAAIDSCRPYPPTVTYGTDDEIDRIEGGRWKFQRLVKAYNEDPTPQRPLFIYETGMSEGFYDPSTDQRPRTSYGALNPLNFYVPRTPSP